MQHVVPALRIRSYDVSRPFYEKLGFREKWIHRFEPGLPVFAAVERDGMLIFLTEHEGDCQFGGLVHFYVPNVDDCRREFVERGIVIAKPPNDSLGPGIREMRIVDPDGNRLSFLTLSQTTAAGPK